MRVNREEIRQIFRKIDVDNDKCIRYSEYRRAIRKTPELLDWFDLLNSAKGSGGGVNNNLTAKSQTINQSDV